MTKRSGSKEGDKAIGGAHPAARNSVGASVDVSLSPEEAFRVYTEEIDLWWKRGPRNFYDARRAVAMRFEPGVGGRLLEVYDEATNDALEIGRIVIWEPGARLRYRSSLDDTEVDIQFERIPGGTRVRLEQRLIPGGTKAQFYTGWPNILSWFATNHSLSGAAGQ